MYVEDQLSNIALSVFAATLTAIAGVAASWISSKLEKRKKIARNEIEIIAST